MRQASRVKQGCGKEAATPTALLDIGEHGKKSARPTTDVHLVGRARTATSYRQPRLQRDFREEVVLRSV